MCKPKVAPRSLPEPVPVGAVIHRVIALRDHIIDSRGQGHFCVVLAGQQLNKNSWGPEQSLVIPKFLPPGEDYTDEHRLQYEGSLPAVPCVCTDPPSVVLSCTEALQGGRHRRAYTPPWCPTCSVLKMSSTP